MSARRWLGALAVCLAGTCTFQCGGEVSESKPAPLPVVRNPETPSAQALELARAQCDYLERCDPNAMHLFSESSRARCEEYFACEAADLPWGVEESHVMLEGCIESLNSRNCPDLQRQPFDRFSYVARFPWGSACGMSNVEGAFVPPPDAPDTGEPCIQTNDERPVCRLGTYCNVGERTLIAGLYHCGTCEARRALGERCDDGVVCIESARCLGGECTELREPSEPCELHEECGSGVCEAGTCGLYSFATTYEAVVDRECDDGRCPGQAALMCEDGKCRPLAEEGEPCGRSDTGGALAGLALPASLFLGCRLGYACLEGRCVALGCRQDLGESCDSSCSAGDCVDNVCVPAEVGDPCHVSCRDALCIDGRCSQPKPRAEDGAPCDFDSDCSSDFCDRHFSEYCTPRDGCVIPGCGKCGVCAQPPTVERCE